MQVEVYSGAEKVRLFLNDKLIGEKPTGREQQFKALPRRQLALCMLPVDALLPAAQSRLFPARLKLFEDFFHGVQWELILWVGHGR